MQTKLSNSVHNITNYEAIYQSNDRQSDLDTLKEWVANLFRDRHVLEIACGSGYWTQYIGEKAAAITATDIVPESLELAQSKPIQCPTTFAQANAYTLPKTLGQFNAAFAGCWWSHIPVQKQNKFLAALHHRLSPGSQVVLIDNLYVEGKSTSIIEWDEQGNSYKHNALHNGSRQRILKNYPSKEDLYERVFPFSRNASFQELDHFWMFSYETI